MVIGGGSTIDPADVGKKIATSLEQLKKSVKHYKTDESEWCDEWKLDEEDMDEHYNDIYNDSSRCKLFKSFLNFTVLLSQWRTTSLLLALATCTSTTESCSNSVVPDLRNRRTMD